MVHKIQHGIHKNENKGFGFVAFLFISFLFILLFFSLMFVYFNGNVANIKNVFKEDKKNEIFMPVAKNNPDNRDEKTNKNMDKLRKLCRDTENAYNENKIDIAKKNIVIIENIVITEDKEKGVVPSINEAVLLKELAKTASFNGDQENAKKMFQLSARILEITSMESSRNYIDVLNEMANIERNEGNIDLVEKYLVSSANVAQTFGDTYTFIIQKMKLGDFYYSQGEAKKAEIEYVNLLEIAEKIIEKNPTTIDALPILEKLKVIHKSQNDTKKSEEIEEKIKKEIARVKEIKKNEEEDKEVSIPETDEKINEDDTTEKKEKDAVGTVDETTSKKDEKDEEKESDKIDTVEAKKVN